MTDFADIKSWRRTNDGVLVDAVDDVGVVDKSLELFSQMTAPDCPLPGVTFYDSNLGWCVLVDDDADAFAGWLARHTDAGTWVTMREATDEDRARLEELQHGR